MDIQLAIRYSQHQCHDTCPPQGSLFIAERVVHQSRLCCPALRGRRRHSGQRRGASRRDTTSWWKQLKTLQQPLPIYHRRQMRTPTSLVMGTNGKTITERCPRTFKPTHNVLGTWEICQSSRFPTLFMRPETRPAGEMLIPGISILQREEPDMDATTQESHLRPV